MLHIVKSPGSCGELIQGAIDGQHFLVTCPINRYSYALSGEHLRASLSNDNLSECLRAFLSDGHLSEHLNGMCSQLEVGLAGHDMMSSLLRSRAWEEMILRLKSKQLPRLQPKGNQMMRLLGYDSKIDEQIICVSELPQGKGLASSSADLSAIAMAASLLKEKALSYKDLERLCLMVEPSDASFYPGVVQFDYKKGTITKELGLLPPLQLLIFDKGGMIDTVRFNAQVDLEYKIKQKEEVVLNALQLLEKGLRLQDLRRIGEAATLSAIANQEILYKPELNDCIGLAEKLDSYGIVIAHSGTVLAFMFDPQRDLTSAVELIVKKCPTLAYFDTVYSTNEGLTYDTINDVKR